jgi:hypothetical protein
MSLAPRAWRAVRWTALFCCGQAALAADPPKSAPPSQSAAQPDAELIEFLGADDVGDADWQEFLGRARPPPSQRKPSRPTSADEDDEHD